ncbi:DUF4959 domain-containing protein [Niabella hirudinis]|uniref:DUF4959 domain-containing protein n=1 Tax=Niabella hirudinis TaxID=1285929 RepID=UPI003EBE9BBA
MKTKLLIIPILLSIGLITACKKQEGFKTQGNDKTPPGAITLKTYTPLYGGARFFYNIPSDEDLVGVEAEYTNSRNQVFKFMASYFQDSLDVYGFGSAGTHNVKLYAVDRSGNRSAPLDVSVEPLEPAYSRVANSMTARAGFSSFFVDWKNELKQNINVYVDYEFQQGGADRKLTTVFSSNLETDRRFVNDLVLGTNGKVRVKVRVEDKYGNMTDPIDKGELVLLEDELIPKSAWRLPNANDTIGGVPMMFGDGLEGRTAKVIDGIIDQGDNLNFLHTHSRGRTGRAADGNMPWNLMIDLGDYYEISRIVTVQRHSGGLANIARGQYYRTENVGIYRVYIWDETKSAWDSVTQNKIDVPLGLTDLEFVKKGEAGDMAYMYPDNPQYTKPTRWIRYEAVKGFSGNYTLEDANCLSEVTLFGRKKK